MLTYLGDPQLKAEFLAEITKHEQQDALIKGTYKQMNGTFKGCAIGCALHSLNVLQGKVGADLIAHTGDHARYEAELGLPTWFAYLEDNIFENLPNELAMTWPRRLAEAIPVGAVVDDRVLARMLGWVLTDPECGVRSATDRDDVRSWIDAVALFIDADSQGTATAEQREAAAWAATAAWAAWAFWAARDALAARAATAATAAWAARDARDARDVLAARAAWDARDAWAARAAWAAAHSGNKADAFFPALADFVLTVVRALPVGTAPGLPV